MLNYHNPGHRGGIEMARKLKKTKRRLVAGSLTKPQLAHLCIGHCLSTVVKWHDKLNFPFQNEEHRKRLWEENRDYILGLRDQIEFFIGYQSGSRPAGWWSYNSPEPRRLISGSVEGYDMDSGLSMGLPRLRESVSESGKFETQFEYLTRLKLLFHGEKEAYFANKKAEKMKKEANKFRLILNNGEFS